MADCYIVALAPAPSSHCHSDVIVAIASPPVHTYGGIRSEKRQKSLFLFTAQYFEKNSSGPSF
jgi:hypothetical protein